MSRKIQLSQGKEVLVDDEDYEFLMQWKWYFCNGYAMRSIPRINGKSIGLIRMHRIIMDTPDGLFVDHINRNKLDNRRINLRNVTKSDNEHNKDIRKRNKSGVNGVCLCKKNNKWQAEIMVDRKHKFLGYFTDLKDAFVARKNAEIFYGKTI